MKIFGTEQESHRQASQAEHKGQKRESQALKT